MFVLGLWISIVIALVTVLVSVLAATLHRDELTDAGNESLSFLRITFTGLFGIVFAQTLSPLNLRWWVTALISLASMFVLLFASQFLARTLGSKTFAVWFAKKTATMVKSLDLLFTPLSVAKAEVTDEFEQELLDSVDEFGETIVREVMVPRVDMATVQQDVLLADALGVFLRSGYSRLPVEGKNIDDVVGVLYLKDVIREQIEDQKGFANKSVGSIARSAIFVPESKPVDDLLRELQIKATHIAVVVDEYGGVAGLVTMEDLIEEIVGDISDEYDSQLSEMQEIGDGKWRVNARYSLFDLGEHFGLELEDQDVDSVGGILVKQLGHLPKKGDEVIYGGLTLTAERIEGRRKRLVSVVVEQSFEALAGEAGE